MGKVATWRGNQRVVTVFLIFESEKS